MKGKTFAAPQSKRVWLFMTTSALFVHSGCTQDEQQGLMDSVGAMLGEQAVQLVGFASDFARSVLAAFLL